jgi:hypothetical protein
MAVVGGWTYTGMGGRTGRDWNLQQSSMNRPMLRKRRIIILAQNSFSVDDLLIPSRKLASY